MKANESKQTIVFIFVLAVGFAAIFFASRFAERNRPVVPENYADEDLSLQGAKLKGYALGFEGLLADWYWMKALQYVGNKFLNSKEDVSLDNLEPLNPRLLYPYLDTAATLDPKFFAVYEYGATVLPAIDKEQAIRLTEKGIENNPANWRLYQYLGFIYWRLGSYEKASEIYIQGSRISGAPDFMRSMAAKMKTEGGSRETARDIYEQISNEARDAQTKENADRHLLELDSLDEREIISKVLTDFKIKNNRCASGWREITPLLQKEKLSGGKGFRVDASYNLIDPSGAAYILDRENCVVELDAERTKIPLK